MREIDPPILHPQVSHPNRLEYASCEQGVAIVVFNRMGEILLGEELHADEKYGRSTGQLNILTETRLPGERIKDNVRRALKEELGSDFSVFHIISGSYRETNGVYGDVVGYQYKYRSICLLWPGDPHIPAHVSFRAPTEEIGLHQWVNPADIHRLDVEKGARLVISYYCAQEIIRQLLHNDKRAKKV